MSNGDISKTASNQRLAQGRRRSSTVTLADLASTFGNDDVRQRISSRNVFRAGYDLSPDIEERLNR
jgi:hypothetical protein